MRNNCHLFCKRKDKLIKERLQEQKTEITSDDNIILISFNNVLNNENGVNQPTVLITI